MRSASGQTDARSAGISSCSSPRPRWLFRQHQRRQQDELDLLGDVFPAPGIAGKTQPVAVFVQFVQGAIHMGLALPVFGQQRAMAERNNLLSYWRRR